MFKVILLVLATLFFIYGMADLMGIIKHIHAYSDAIPLMLSGLCMMIRSLLVKDEIQPQAKRNKNA